MASYDAWNRAIVSYFTAGVGIGAPIFLSVDIEALEEIAAGFLDEPVADGPALDFVTAVKQRCAVPGGDAINIAGLAATIGSLPGCVGFLGLLVFAAYNMQEADGIDESNYFLRLREVLGLPSDRGRPVGLPTGAEEKFWKVWNHYLVAHGWLDTAERGVGSQTYLRYILSQAILRKSDKQYLAQRFQEGHPPLHCDCDQLGFWLSRQQINRRHLSEGLHHPDPHRVWEFYRAAHRVYEAGNWLSKSARNASIDRATTRSIECGLYRTEDLTGAPEYWIFPKQPARIRSTPLMVELGDDKSMHPLRPLRAGFFAPLWMQAPFVHSAVEHRIFGDSGVQQLFFPMRDFWILVCDPENPNGAWASWKPYSELGEQLLLLCRPGVFDTEMTRMRDAKLIEWSNRVECAGWVEFHGCMVLSYDWGAFIASPECRALAAALAPRVMAGISLSGGLRDPNQNAWLEGHVPTLKIYGFERQFEVVVTSTLGAQVFHAVVVQQDNVPLPSDLEPGTYQIEAKWSGRRATARVFHIVPWNSIREHPDPEKIVNCSPFATGGVALRGAILCSSGAISGEVPGA